MEAFLQNETNAVFREALVQLLRDRPLRDISVTALCGRAGLHRSTFYAHYRDIYGVLEEIQEEMKEGLLQVLGADRIRSPEELPAMLEELFAFIGEHRELYRACFLPFPYAHTMDVVQEGPLYAGILSSAAKMAIPREELPYRLSFFTGGLSAMIRRWLDDGCAESPAELARILCAEYAGRMPDHA